MIKLQHITIAFVLGALAFSSQSNAHAFLDRAEPAVDATVDQPPAKIKIWFTANIDILTSDIHVFDAAGNQIDKKDTRGDPDDKTLLIIPVPPLPAGEYTVRWHATTTADHHKTKGEYKFRIASH